jgi:hypothetical protein
MLVRQGGVMEIKRARDAHISRPLIVAVTLLALGTAIVAAYKWAMPKGPSALVGNWIGISDGDVFTYRLQLSKNGTGMFAFQLTNETPDLYRVTTWCLTGKTVAFDVCATPASSESVSLRGTVAGTRILLRVTGRDWRHRVEMWNEDKVLPRILALRESMQRLEQNTNSVDKQL